MVYAMAPPAAAIVTSDSFDRADGALAGSSTDAALGGVAKAWTAVTAAFRILGNTLVRNAASAVIAGFDAGVVDVQVTAKVAALPASGDFIVLYGRAGSVAATVDSYRVTVSGTGVMTLQRSVSTTVTTLASTAPGVVMAGDVVGLRADGTTIDLVRNGAVVASVTDSGVTSGSYVVVRLTGTVGTSGAMDDLKVEAP